MLKDIVGRSQDELQVKDGSALGDIFDVYAARYPRLSELAASIEVLALSHNPPYELNFRLKSIGFCARRRKICGRQAGAALFWVKCK